MQFTYCDYNPSTCMSSSPVLTPSYDGRLQLGSAPSMFFSGSTCFWKITAPGEWTSNSIIKVKITNLKNSKCFLNYGGS